jgi:Ser/Thr protein kinase RdoA (MazF antagonist)
VAGPADLVKVIERDYGVGATRLLPIYEQGNRAFYRLEHDAGHPWVLRWFQRERSLDRVAGDADVLRSVGQLDVEQLVTTIDGQGHTVVDGRGVLVTKYLDGVAAVDDPAVVRRIGATLGAAASIPIDVGTRAHRRAGSLPREDLVAAGHWLDEICGHVPHDLLKEYEQLNRDVARTRDCEEAPLGLVHSDCHLANVIAVGARPVLFDWEGSGLGPLVAALGWLLFTAAVASPDRPPTPLNEAAVHATIDGYQSVRPLQEVEVDLLSDAIRFRPLVIACRQLRQAVLHGISAHGWWSRYPESETVAATVRGAA